MCWRGDTRSQPANIARLRSEISAHVEKIASTDGNAAKAIVGELLANVHRHAPGPYCVEMTREGGVSTIVVHDSGPCFEPASAPRAGWVEWFEERGRGLAVIEAHGAVVETARAPQGGCRVTVSVPAGNKHAWPIQPACPHDHPASRGEHCPRVLSELAVRHK